MAALRLTLLPVLGKIGLLEDSGGDCENLEEYG